MENFEEMLAKNLAYLRKEKKLTQGELAEKLKYSDKTVSKWETGEAVPDVETLIEICSIFGVSISEITSGPVWDRKIKEEKEEKKESNNKFIISLLAISLIWILVTVAYVYANIAYAKNIWIVFIWAVPSSFVLAIIFNSIWGRRFFTFIFVSLFMWTFLVALFLTLIKVRMWPVFLLGIPGQIAIILWSRLKPKKKKLTD